MSVMRAGVVATGAPARARRSIDARDHVDVPER
jgi:hypothetical protein